MTTAVHYCPICGKPDSECTLHGAAIYATDPAMERGLHEGEGWTRDHDDGHTDEGLARMAALYALPDSYRAPNITAWVRPNGWRFKAADRIRELEKAGALIAAEIDRLLAARLSSGDAPKGDLP